jgi:predicted DsbA family dithiol-disulfide isomerase
VEIEKLGKEYDLRVDWRPFFLRPETPPEGMPLPDYVKQRMKDPNDPLKLRAAREGLKMVRREIVPSTQRAHEAAEFARAHGKLDPMHAALLRRYWSEGQDLWSFETLRGAAAEAGLDPDELQKAIEEARFRTAVEGGVREAHELGIRAVPTFIFDGKLAVQGAQELPVFRSAMQRLSRAPRTSREN